MLTQTGRKAVIIGLMVVMLSKLPTFAQLLPDSTSNPPIIRIAGNVIFPVNEYTLQPRDSMLVRLDSLILPQARREGWQLVSMTMKSSASPEGTLKINTELGRRRGEAIMEFLRERIPLPPDLTVTNMVEDYDYLIDLMEQAGDKATARVRRMMIAANGNTERLKTLMKQADKGVLWRRLLKEYFPKLRAARLELEFKGKAVPRDTIPALPRDTVPIVILPKDTIPKDALPTVSAPRDSIPIDEEPTLPTLPTPPETTPPLEILRAPALAIKTNLLYDVFYMPNFGWAPMPDVELEYFPRHGQLSYIAAFTFPYWHRWSRHKFFQIRDYRAEVRYYFARHNAQKPQSLTAHTGFFLGASGNYNEYGVGFSKTKGWEGEGWGASLTTGFVHRLRKGHSRWRLEYVLGLGYYETRFDPYVYGNPITGSDDGDYYYDYTGPASDFHRRNHRRKWFGPTQLGIKLSYDLFHYKEQRRGIGLKRKEMLTE